MNNIAKTDKRIDKYLNKIIQGNCLEVMKTLPDNSVDLIVTDPPYGINFKRGYRKSEKIIGDSGFDIMLFLDDYFLEFERLLKNGTAIYWFTRFDTFPYVYIKLKRYFDVKNLIIWDKDRETTGLGDRQGAYANNYECIVFAVKGRHLLREKIKGAIWNFKTDGNGLHPTQKPVALMEEIIKYSSNNGDLILDPFIGSGTTAVACKKSGRNYIGIEINPEYVRVAEDRLRQEVLL